MLFKYCEGKEENVNYIRCIHLYKLSSKGRTIIFLEERGVRNLQAQTIIFSATSTQTIFFQATVLQTIFFYELQCFIRSFMLLH